MNQTLINILIRTSFRPTTFARCIRSITDQTYKNIRVIVSYDDPRALEYIPDWCEKLPVTKSTEPYGYNLYCNDLKAQVKEGWFLFLDDDDRLYSPTALEELAAKLVLDFTHCDALVVQFIRGAIVKPAKNEIVKGKIGMPCIVMNADFKDFHDFKATEDADFYFIKNIVYDLYTMFEPLILVRASRRGHGYIES